MSRHGQFLLVRPLVEADLPDLRRITGTTEMTLPVPGLLARLVGEPVGFLAYSPAGTELRIDQIFVAADLRRKRIGRGLLMETEQLARRLNCTALVVSPHCQAGEFFTQVGFEERDSLFRKTIRRQ